MEQGSEHSHQTWVPARFLDPADLVAYVSVRCLDPTNLVAWMPSAPIGRVSWPTWGPSCPHPNPGEVPWRRGGRSSVSVQNQLATPKCPGRCWQEKAQPSLACSAAFQLLHTMGSFSRLRPRPAVRAPGTHSQPWYCRDLNSPVTELRWPPSGPSHHSPPVTSMMPPSQSPDLFLRGSVQHSTCRGC